MVISMMSSIPEKIPFLSNAKDMISHCLDCEWRKTAMMFAVAAAVAGVAVAFFSQSLLAGVGFALLGLTGALGLWIVRDTLDEKQLKAVVTEVAEEAVRMEDAQKKVEIYTKIIQAQTAMLQKKEKEFQELLDAIKHENQKLLLSKKQLEEVNEELRASNRSLEKTNAELGGKVVDLSGLLADLKAQVQSFLQKSIDFGTRVGAFSSSVSSLSKQDDALRAAITELDTTFDENMEQLTAQMQFAKDSIVQLLDFICTQKEAIQEQLRTLEVSTHKIEALDALLKTRGEELATKEKEIAAENTRLAEIKGQIASVQTQFREDQVAFTAQCEELARIQRKISEERAGFDQIKEKLAAEKKAIEEVTMKLLAELEQTVRLKQEEVTALDEQIRQKRATLAS